MATYLILNLLFTAGLAVFARPRPDRYALIGLVVLLTLTLVFDTVIIALGIVGYHDARISGLRIGVIPIEDFFYAIGAAILVPALWERQARR